MLFIEGDMFPTIKVNVLPIKESCSKRVNLDYLKLATLLFLLERLAITFPKVVRDAAMFVNYLNWSVVMSPLFFTF